MNKIKNINLVERVSYKEKMKKKMEWFEKKADAIWSYGRSSNSKRNEKFEINYDLFNSRAKLELFNDTSTLEAYYMGELSGGQVVKHLDIISNIASSMVGDEQKRPFKPICIDVSDGAVNDYKNKKTELIQQLIHQKVIQPIIEQVTQQVQEEFMSQAELDENGQPIITEEQQQQINQTIEQSVQELTPEYISQYLRKGYKGGAAIGGQKLVKYLVKELKLKFLFNEGFKNFVITGHPIFYGTIINDKVHAELVNPKNFEYGGSDNIFFIEDADWWRYTQSMSLFEVYKRYAHKLTKEDMETLDSAFSEYITQQEDEENVKGKLAYEFSLEPERIENIDLLDSEGQDAFAREYVRALHSEKGNAPIEHVHCVWKALALFKNVKRNVDGKEESFWVDGSYEEGPEDIEVKEVWIPQICETTILSYGAKKVYINKGFLESQYDSLEDPFNIKGPYFGIEYGKFFGNTESIAPMDKGKPFQHEYNVVRSKLINDLANDKGKILLALMNAMPKNWSPEKWLSTLKDGVLLVGDELRGVDPQLMKSIDLSAIQDISSRLQHLEAIKQDCAMAMQYNPSRMGQVSPYMTATNNQQNIMQSLSQTEDIYSTYNVIKENFLTYLVKLAKLSYLKNPKNFYYILDDYTIADIEIDPTSLGSAKFGVYITNNSEDIDNLIQTKYNIQPMIQNQLLTFPESIRAQWASSEIEILNIAENAEKRRQEEAERQQQYQRELEEMKAQAEERRLQMEKEHLLEMFDRNAALQIELKLIDSLKYANQYDIDKDGMNDNLEIEREKLEHEKEENQKDRLQEMKKLSEELKNKIEVERIKLKNKTVKK